MLSKQEKAKLAREARAFVLENIKARILQQAIKQNEDRINYWVGKMAEELEPIINKTYPLEEDK